MQQYAVPIVRELLPVAGFVGGVTGATFAVGLAVGAVRGAGTAVARFV
jgi:hypothetical protein